MSRYNNGSSIPIRDIPESELESVMEDWAEGSESLKKLLLTCYHKGIETSGCHYGATQT